MFMEERQEKILELLEPHLPGQRGQWRGIATRYAKLIESFLAAVLCRCIAIWTDYLL